MLLAVLEKRAGFRLGAKDVFLNITGGITVDDPAIDLAVVAAILSSKLIIQRPHEEQDPNRTRSITTPNRQPFLQSRCCPASITGPIPGI